MWVGVTCIKTPVAAPAGLTASKAVCGCRIVGRTPRLCKLRARYAVIGESVESLFSHAATWPGTHSCCGEARKCRTEHGFPARDFRLLGRMSLMDCRYTGVSSVLALRLAPTLGARSEPPYPVLLLPLPFGSASQEQSDAAAPTQAPAKVGTRISGKTPIAGAGATLGPSSGDKTGARNPLRHDPGGTAPAHEPVRCYGGESRLLRDVPRRHGPARAITSVGPVQPGVRALHTPRPFLTWNSHSTCSSRLRLLCNRGGSHALPRPERYYR
jgi:hypothetical protein